MMAMKKFLLTAFATLWLLISLGDRLLAQENIAVWKFPQNVTDVTCVSSSILASDCDFSSEGSVSVSGSNSPNTVLCDDTDNTKSLQISGINGGSAIFKISTMPYVNIGVSYDLRCHPNMAAGYPNYTWSYSMNGVDFIDAPASTAVTGFASTSFETMTADFSSVAALNGKAEVWLKLTMSGAESASCASNLDNVVFTGTISNCLAPTDLAVSAVTMYTAFVSWIHGGGDDAASYSVFITTDPDAEPTDETTVTETQKSFTGLTQGTTYYVYVRANCSETVSSSWVSTSFTTCYAPSGLTVSNVTGVSADIAWTDTVNSQWQVCVTSTTADWTNAEVVNQPSYHATGLTLNTAYTVYVRPYCTDCSCIPGAPGTVVNASFRTLFAESSIDVTIGNGTTLASTTPFHNLWKISWDQSLYTVEEVGHAGTIGSIAWYSGTTNTVHYSDLRIYMGTTDLTSVTTSSWVPMSDLTLVYSSTDYTAGGVIGWETFTLDLPYVYDGSGSLVVVVVKNTLPDTYNNSVTYRYTSVSNRVIYRNNDSDVSYAQHPGTVTGTATTYLPNIKLVIGDPHDVCLPVSGLTVVDETMDGATIAWSPGTSETSWIVKYGVAGFNVETEGTEQIANDTTLVLSGLSAATTYDVYVKAVCDAVSGDESGWKKEVFNTECGILDMPYTANFEEYTATTYSVAGELPMCWDYEFGGTAAYAPHVSTSAAINGNGLVVNANSANAAVVIMPELAGNLNEAIVKFDTKYNSASYGILSFGYYIEGEGFSTLQQLTSSTSLTHNVIDLSNESTIPAGARLAFEYTSTYSSLSTYYVNIDNVVVLRQASCGYVSEVTVPSATNTAASVTWETEGDATQWQVMINGVVYDADTNAYRITGLSGSTTYHVYVRALCGNGEYSDYSECTFTTTCDPITVNSESQYNENFDAIAQYEIPECWSRFVPYQTASYTYPYVYSGSTYANSGAMSLRMYTYSSGNAPENIIAMPPMNNVNALQVSFSARYYSTKPQFFEVGYIRNGEFVAVESITNLTTSYQQYVVYMNEAPADAEAIAFRSYHGTSSAYAHIDDINVTSLPACVAPYHLAVRDITANSATITWTDVTEVSAWQYMIDGGDIIDTDEKPLSLTGLTSNTPYEVMIRANCGDGTYTDWSVVSFSTMCDVVSVPYSEDFDSYTSGISTSTSYPTGYPNITLPSCWTFVNMTTSTSGYPMAFLTSYSAYAAGGNCLFFKSSNSTPLYAVLPEFSENIENLKLEFKYRNESTTDYNGTLHVGLASSLDDIETNYIEVKSFERTTTITSASVNFYEEAPSQSGSMYIVFKYVGGSSSNYFLSIDDVDVRILSSDNTILSYAATTVQGDAICALDNETHTMSAQLRLGYNAGDAITPVINLNSPYANILQQVGNDFVELPATIAWYMTSTDTTFIYKVIAENGDEQLYTSIYSLEACPAPSGLVSEQTSLTTVDLSWTSHEQTSAWDFFISTTPMSEADLETADYTQLTATSTTVTVVGETTYYWYVRTVCDNGNSAWLNSSFLTWENCVPPTNITTELVGDNDIMLSWDVQDNLPVDEFDLIEDFEDDVIGDGSIDYINDATYPWTITNAASHGGTYSIKSGNYHVASSISSVKISVNYVTNGTISFYGRVSSEQTSVSSDYDYGTFYIDNVQQGSRIINSGAFSYFVYDVPAGTHLFEWRYKKDGSVNSNDDCFYVDDIRIYYMSAISSVAIYRNNEAVDTLSASVSSYIDANLDAGTYCYSLKTLCREGSESEISDQVCQEINNCLAVTNILVGSVTYNSATLTWTRGSSETSWNIIINGVQVTINEFSAGVTVDGDEISYVLAGLEPNTQYEIAINANCGSAVSLLPNSVQFTTERVPATLPYTCDFENDSENSDWLLQNGTQTNKWVIGSATGNTGTGLYISNNNGTSNTYTVSTASYVYAYRTIYFDHASEYVVAFNWKANGESINDYMRAFLVPADVTFTAGSATGITTTNVPSRWIALDGSMKLNLQSTWQDVQRTISVDSAGMYNLVFYWVNNASGGTQAPAAVDNVSVAEVSCPSVANVVVSDVTNNSANITWTERGDATAWQIIVSPTALTPTQLASATPVDLSVPSYTATDLTQTTTYHVYVRANCSVDDNSSWVEATFTTVANCPTPTDLVVTLLESNSITVEWEGYHATNWTFEYKLSASADWTVVENVTETTFTISTEPATAYTMRVKAACEGGEETVYVSINVTTPCVSISEFPWTEDFNDLTVANSIPDCWNNSEGTTTTESYKWIYNTSTSGNGATSGTSHDGSNCVRFNSWVNSNGNTNMLKTVTLDLSSLNVAFLDFWYKNPTGGDFSVYISTDGGATYANNVVATGLTGVSEWTLASYNIAPYCGNSNVVIVFKGTSNYGSGDAYIYLDDVNVHAPSTEAEILTYTLPSQLSDATINSEAALINITVAYGTDMSTLNPTITVSDGATYEAANPVVGDPFTTTIDYDVTAEDGLTVKQWTAIVHRSTIAHTEKDILSFSFDGQLGESVIDVDAHTVSATASWNVNLSAIAPTITISPWATISPATGVAQNFSNPFVYTVTAEDGTAQEWTVTIVHDPELLASLPYSCDFEDASENANWVFENGSLVNKWVVGTAANNGGENGMYISNDNGVSNTYTTNSLTYVYAYRQINVEETSSYNISFDWKAYGEGNYDFIRAFVVPVSVEPDFTAGTSNGIEGYNNTGFIPQGWIDIANPNGKLNLANDWQSSETTKSLNAGVYNIVFLWKNDASGGTQNPAAIDNISIERVSYIITATAGENGTITPNGEVSVYEGSDASFDIAPDDGYQIASVLVDGVDDIESVVNGVYTFNNVMDNHTIAVTFDLLPVPVYTITATAGSHGTITPNGQVSVAEGGNQSFTIVPSSGYRIASVMVDGVEAINELADGVYTFTNVTSDHTIAATFSAIPTYTIVATYGVHGMISPAGSISVIEGRNQTFVLTPDEGYHIATLTVDGEDGMLDIFNMSYTFYDVRENHTIDVTFASDAVDEYIAASMAIYPNPNNGMFSIDFSNIEGDAIYEIIDARGAVVETRDINVANGETMIFEHNLRPGTYIVRIINADRVYVGQIVVE